MTDEQLVMVLDPEMNSIALIVKHMAGNMRSRWTDFLASDGEKPDRDRDAEFMDPPASREEVMNCGSPAGTASSLRLSRSLGRT